MTSNATRATSPELLSDAALTPDTKPTAKADVKGLFGIDVPFKVPAFSKPGAYTPDIDPNYHFEPATTRAILAGFAENRRVLVHGLHGTGKSTHIEQVAARLGWPCVRINLDSHISRIDLVGRDAIVLRDGKQVTEFREGLLPWALQRPVALVFDEYDAGRPDVMFVIQRVLEAHGKFTLLDQNRVLTPHPFFRIFATANTIGLGDATGIYHGTQAVNQGQMDRWHVVVSLNYLSFDRETDLISTKLPEFIKRFGKEAGDAMVSLAGLTRSAFVNGDISTVMSPRTVLTWAENSLIFDDIDASFLLSFLNRCDEAERPVIAEMYQRCFNRELPGQA